MPAPLAADSASASLLAVSPYLRACPIRSIEADLVRIGDPFERHHRPLVLIGRYPRDRTTDVLHPELGGLPDDRVSLANDRVLAATVRRHLAVCIIPRSIARAFEHKDTAGPSAADHPGGAARGDE